MEVQTSGQSIELSKVSSLKKNPWTAFKRKNPDQHLATGNVKVRKQQVQTNTQPKKDQPSPHICLKCGTELVRGRESYKIRHWQQRHKNEDPKNAPSNIVPNIRNWQKNLITTIKK